MGMTPAQIFVQQDNMDQQRRHALEDQGRQQTLEFNQGILNNPDAPDEQKLQARQNIQGLYPTPAHAPQFLLDLLHIKHRQANQPTAQAQKDAQSTSHGNAVTNTPPTPGDGGSESTTPGPAPAANPVQAIQGGAAPQVPTPAPQPASSAQSASPAPVAQVRQVAQAQTPQDALAQIRAYASPGQQANSLQQQLQDKMAERQEALAKANNAARIEEAHIRAGGNVSMQKLNAAAQSLGEDDFASATPENKMAAIKSLHQANVTPSWKPVVDDQQNVYAVDAHDPSKRTFLAHKSDLTTRLEYKTLTNTNADGSSTQYEVPMTVWSKKGSTVPIGETQGPPPPGFEGSTAPVSAKTPQLPTSGVSNPPNNGNVTSTAPPVSAKTPANPGARAPGTKPAGGAVKTGLPKGSIAFGGKESPTLYKAAAANYEKQVPILEASENSINGYLQGGAFTGPGDLALQHEFFTATQPSTGFRMTKVQQDILHDSQSLINKLRAAGANITGGTIYSPEQRQQIAKAALDAIASKKKTYSQSLEDAKHPESMPKSANTPAGPGSKHEYAIDNNGKRRKVLDANAKLPQGWTWAD